jgi:hypothetical protein
MQTLRMRAIWLARSVAFGLCVGATTFVLLCVGGTVPPVALAMGLGTTVATIGLLLAIHRHLYS